MAGCLLQALLVGEAAAQQDATTLDDVVVSARYRDENAQKVPTSVTAFTKQEIEDAGIASVKDFIALTPNMTFVNSMSAGTSFVSMRGLTQNRNQSAPMAIVVDGVEQINDRQFAAGLLDIQSIEVLRGPQGALYGRNASAGAVLIHTVQPTDEYEGHAQVGIGRGSEQSYQAAFGGPIVKDLLKFRVAASYTDRDGYFTNINLDKKADPYENTKFQGALAFTPSDNFDAHLRLFYDKINGGAMNLWYQATLLADDGMTLADVPNPYGGTINDANRLHRYFYSSYIGHNDRDLSGSSLDWNYTFGSGIRFSSITAYTDVMEYYNGDQYGYTAGHTRWHDGGSWSSDGTQTQYLDVDAWSQQFRLSSADDQRFRWMLGAYYLKTDRFISTTSGEDLGRGIARLTTRPKFDDPDNPTQSFMADDNDDKAWAWFGNVALDVTERFTTELGLRYDKDEREQYVSPYSTAGAPGAINKASFDMLQPKVSLRYAVSDDAQLFMTWGKGFRSGAFNQNGAAAAASASGLVGAQDVAKAEEVETWELGFKSEWLGHRLRLNGTLYSSKIDNSQYFVFVSAANTQMLLNIDRVDVWGGEMELAYRMRNGLQVSAGLGHSSSEIKAYSITPGDVGNQAPFVPKWTGNLGVQYYWSLGEKWGLMSRVDYEYRGSQFWTPENETAREPLNLLNLNLSLESKDGLWKLTSSVTNLTDKAYNEEFGGGGWAYPANPRVWRLALRRNF